MVNFMLCVFYHNKKEIPKKFNLEFYIQQKYLSKMNMK